MSGQLYTFPRQILDQTLKLNLKNAFVANIRKETQRYMLIKNKHRSNSETHMEATNLLIHLQMSSRSRKKTDKDTSSNMN